MKSAIFVIMVILSSRLALPQTDEKVISEIYTEQLTNSPIYENLRYLTKEIGNRINGSTKLSEAVEYTKQLMIKYQFDTVYLQPVMVPNWIRGKKEIVRIMNSTPLGIRDLNCLALGNSIGTGEKGLIGEVIEINSLEELMKADKNLTNGKIIFLNQPLDKSLISTHEAYRKGRAIRTNGASQASIKGAIAVIIRSLSTGNNDSPVAGYMAYDEGVNKIPAVSISTNDADLLSAQIKRLPKTTIYFETHCQTQEMALSYNVIGEIRGNLFPDEIILVGSHIDTWDVGEGAQDNGGGCLQAIEVLRSFKIFNIRPKHTLRVVMWADEENGDSGDVVYAEESLKKKEVHIAAIEPDYGAFSPIGFTIDTDNEIAFNKLMSWKNYFEPYQIFQFNKGYPGDDIIPLKNNRILLLGLMTDSQRYYSLMHSEKDVFEAVDKRELELGAAAITSIVYLIDKYGLN